MERCGTLGCSRYTGPGFSACCSRCGVSNGSMHSRRCETRQMQLVSILSVATTTPASVARRGAMQATQGGASSATSVVMGHNSEASNPDGGYDAKSAKRARSSTDVVLVDSSSNSGSGNEENAAEGAQRDDDVDFAQRVALDLEEMD